MIFYEKLPYPMFDYFSIIDGKKKANNPGYLNLVYECVLVSSLDMQICLMPYNLKEKRP